MRDKIQYTDTLDVYKAYIDGGRKQNFRKAHTDEIEKYEAAKERLREAEKQLDHKPPPMKELKAERAQLKEKGDILGAAYKKAKNESKELTAARVTVEKQLGIGKASVQHKPSIKERLEANKTHIENREQKKPSSTPMPPQKGKDMDVHGMLEHYKAEAENTMQN